MLQGDLLRQPRPPRGTRAKHVPGIIAVPDLPVREAARTLQLFGWPVHLCGLPDGEGRALGGPQRSPADWLWGVYAGPSAARRRQALGLIGVIALEAWRERARARGTFAGYVGLRTLAGYYLLAQDVDGPYLTGYSELFTFDPMPSQPPKFVYRQLVRAARWLRQSANSAPRLATNPADR
jgi:hypothetical protein